MKQDKTWCVIGLFVLTAVIPAGSFFAGIAGYRVVFAHPWLSICAFGVPAVALTVLLVIWCKKAQVFAAELLAMLLPFVSETALLVLAVGQDSCMWIVGVIFCVCAVVAANCCVKRVWMGVVSFLLTLPLLLCAGLVGLSLLFPMSEETVLQTTVSPDGAYVAQLIDNDQGALGGATVITLRRTEGEIDLLFFALEHKPETVYCGNWGEGFGKTLAWKDGDTLTLGGTPIEINP